MNNRIKKPDLNSVYKSYIFLLPFLVLTLGLVVPMCTLFVYGFYDGDTYVGLDNLWKYLADDTVGEAFANSMWIGFITTLTSTTLAFVYAWGLCYTRISVKPFLSGLMYIPLLAPSMFGAISLTFLFGKQGVASAMLLGYPLNGAVGIYLASVFFTLPQAFVILYPIMKNIDGRLFETARSFNASASKILRTLTMPMMGYGLFSTFTVVFIMTVTDFGVAKVIGGQYSMLATEVYKQVVGQQNFNMGAVLSILMITPAIITGIIEYYFVKPSPQKDLMASVYSPPKNLLRDSFWNFGIWFLALLVLAPLIMGAAASVITYWPYDLRLTLDNYNFNAVGGFGFTPVLNSIAVSLLTAIIGALIIFVNSYLITRIKHTKILRIILHKTAMIPSAIPGTSLGIAYIFFFNSADGFFNGIYDTIWILVLVNVIHFYTVPHLSFTSAFQSMSKDIEDVSKTLSVSMPKTFMRVIIPINAQGILHVMEYMFIASMTTISAVIFLYGADTMLASTVVVNLDDAGETSYALAMCILIIAVNIFTKITVSLLKKYIFKA